MPLYETRYASLSPCQPRCLDVPRPSDLTSRPARTGLLSTGSPEADRCLGAVAPGIEQHDARRLEVSGVTGDDGQAVRRGGGGDESVPVSLRVGNEHSRATPGDRYVDRQEATDERGNDLMLQPVPKEHALRAVTALNAQDADLELHDRYDRDVQASRVNRRRPAHDARVSAARSSLPQLRHHVRVEEVHLTEVRNPELTCAEADGLELDVLGHGQKLHDAAPLA